ncbi:MAG: hypothetical protein ACK5HR_06010 [Mycoplasmatales bacterium]
MKNYTISYTKWEQSKDILVSEDQIIGEVLKELGIVKDFFIKLHNSKRIENNLSVSFKELGIKENEKIEIMEI